MDELASHQNDNMGDALNRDSPLLFFCQLFRPDLQYDAGGETGDDQRQNQGFDDIVVVGGQAFVEIERPFAGFEDQLDVIVATHKIIDLVFHTQVYKLKRDMAKKPASVSSSSLTWKDTMERSDETPADSPTTERGRSASVGAAAQGAHNHSGTSGGHPCK